MILAETHHCIDDKLTAEEAMAHFRRAYSSIRLTVYEDMLVYSTSAGWSEKAAREANSIIRSLNLPLVAESTKLLRKDSFTVKPIL